FRWMWSLLVYLKPTATKCPPRRYFFDDGEKLEHGSRQPVDARRQHLIARRKGLQKFSEFLAVTRVYRGHVLAALTRALARRLCRLQPPSPSPAPCRVY